MAKHNATKVLPLTSQTKLTLNITLTLLNPLKSFYWIYKRNFLRKCVARFVGAANNSATRLLKYLSYTQFSIRQRDELDHSSLKEGFCGVFIEKGARFLVGIKQKKQRNCRFCSLKIEEPSWRFHSQCTHTRTLVYWCRLRDVWHLHP